MKRALASAVLLFALLALPVQGATIPVSGRVADSDGKAVPDAKVLLIPLLSEVEAGRLQLAGKLTPEPAASVSTDADGAFRLAAPDAGMWVVRVETPGFVPQEAVLTPLLEETDLPEVRLTRDVRFQARVTDPLLDLHGTYFHTYFHFEDQIRVERTAPHPVFGLGGDSGSLVVTSEGTDAVGLYFAGPDSGLYGIANPIGAVLTELEITLI